MVTPYPYGMAAHPQQLPVVLMPSPQPPQLPPGYGCLCADFTRGPYLLPATTTLRFKVSGHETPMRMSPGRWFVPVLAGWHRIKLTDPFGFPVITTEVDVRPGGTHYLRFEFGSWRNRVRDGAGADITRFGLWSNYTIGLITLGVGGLVCCLPVAAIIVLSA